MRAGPDLMKLGPSEQFFFGAPQVKKCSRKNLHREGVGEF